MSQIKQSNKNNVNVSKALNMHSIPTIDYSKINSSVTLLAEKLSQINYSAISNSTITAVEKLSQNYSSISTSMASLAEKLSQFDYSSVSNASILAIEKLSLNYSAINNSVTSLAENLSRINYSAINKSMISFAEKLSNSNNILLSNSVASLQQNLSKLAITEDRFHSFMDNFEKLSNSASLDELDFDSISYEESKEIASSSKEIIEKITTGTLEYSDVKNNKPQIYCIIILNFLLTFIFNYILTLGLDTIREHNSNINISEDKVLSSEYDINLKIITADILNVREQPNSKSKVIYQLNSFDIVPVINEQPYWFEIKYIDLSDNQTKTGWIAKKYTKDYFSTLEYYSEYFSK